MHIFYVVFLIFPKLFKCHLWFIYKEKCKIITGGRLLIKIKPDVGFNTNREPRICRRKTSHPRRGKQKPFFHHFSCFFTFFRVFSHFFVFLYIFFCDFLFFSRKRSDLLKECKNEVIYLRSIQKGVYFELSCAFFVGLRFFVLYAYKRWWTPYM